VVKGLGKAVNGLKSTKRFEEATKGFRYEIEGAAQLQRSGSKHVDEMSEGVSVPWVKGDLGAKTGRTDIDVVVIEDNKRICYQFKRSAEALGSLDDVRAWVKK
jgi:hypothetical protein